MTDAAGIATTICLRIFLANLGLGGACAHCDEPLLLTELLGEGGVTLLD
jgi:hypothetical protein